MKIFGYRFTKESPSLEASEILKLNARLRKEEKLRDKVAKETKLAQEAEKKKTDKIQAKQKKELKKILLEQATRRAYDKKTRAKAGLVNLEQAERYTLMMEREGISPARKAALEAIVVSRLEAVRAMGYNIDGMINPMNSLKRLANGS